MLIRFRVRNFRSLRDEQELSMVAALKDGGRGVVHVDSLGLDLLRVAGIYGANAAGKSNVLGALRFMKTAVSSSHRQWKPEGPIPHEPFILDPAWKSKPSTFVIDFLLQNVHFQYGFELNSEMILREWLHAFPNRRRQSWFSRQEQEFSFGKSLKGNHRTIQGLTRRNSLFLSAAAENNHPTLAPVYNWLAGKILFVERVGELARLAFSMEMAREDWGRTEILDMLQVADLGIVDLKTREVPLDPRARDLIKTRLGVTQENERISALDKMETMTLLELYHRSRGGPVAFSLDRESRGTQAWLALAGPVLHALKEGAVLCVDELDSSLHPILATEAIKFFEGPTRNTTQAQLIFNSHDTTLLGNLLRSPGLRRDQVWFVEKDEEGATKLYPLTDFKPRNLENLERGYLQGRYGAVPFIEPAEVGEDA